MRLSAAFFANRAEVVDHMLNVEGAFWKSVTIAPRSIRFVCSAIILCEMDATDVGQKFALHIDVNGPMGHQLAPAFSTEFTVDTPSMFMCFPSMALPIDPQGGRHVYTFRLDGQHERVDVPLAVRVARG
jgi:hypothetical protein